MRKGRWVDWAAVAAGLLLGLSWVWHGMLGVGGGAFFVLGLGVILAAVISMTRPAAVTGEMGVLGIGVLVFALPWLLGFTRVPAAAWTAWILGAAIALLGAYGLTRANRVRKRDPELAWTTHTNEIPE